MAYCGLRTTENAIIWILIAVLLVTGLIWLPIGTTRAIACKDCRNQLRDLDIDSQVNFIDEGCLIEAFAFKLYEPDQAQVENSAVLGNFYSFCMGGAYPALIGGAVSLGVGLLLPIFFIFAQKPPTVVHVTMPVGAMKV